MGAEITGGAASVPKPTARCEVRVHWLDGAHCPAGWTLAQRLQSIIKVYAEVDDKDDGIKQDPNPGELKT